MLINDGTGTGNNQIDQTQVTNGIALDSFNLAVRSQLPPELLEKWDRLFSKVTFVGRFLIPSAFAKYIASGNILDTIEKQYVQSEAESIRLFTGKADEEGLRSFFTACDGSKRVLMVFLPITLASRL